MKQGLVIVGLSIIIKLKQLTYRLFLKYLCFRQHLVILMGINIGEELLLL